MDYSIIVISESDLPDDPAFVFPFKAQKIEDLEVAFQAAMGAWSTQDPGRDFRETGCTVLVERAPVWVQGDVKAEEAEPISC